MSIFERRVGYTTEYLAQLGRDAKDILSTDVYYLAMEEAEIDFLEVMKGGETVEERETARSAALALDGVLKALREIQSDGEHAERVLEERAKEE